MKKVLYILGSFVFAIGLFAILNTGNKAFAETNCGGDNKANFNNAGELNCGDEEYRYDPVASQRAGVPVFVENSGRYIAIRNEGGQVQSIIADCPSGNGTGDPCFTGNYNPFAPGGTNEDIIGLENFANANLDLNGTDGSGTDGGPFCSLVLPTDCYPWAGNKYDNFSGSRCDNTPNGDNKPCRFTGAAPAGLDDLLEALDVAAAGEDDSCEDVADNPLSFILCPLQRAMVNAVDGLTGFLIEQLKLQPITDYGSGSVNPIQRGFNNFRNIANSLYIIIFLVIILSNFISVGLDNYSIKKMLPRLLFAVIATQFAFLLCSLVVDFSNVLIVGLPSAVGTIANVPDTFGGAISVSFADVLDNGGAPGALQGIALVIFILILCILMLIVVVIALAYLVFRNVFLLVLIFLSPLAIAAWVLPQTQTFAKKWWNWFIKLVVMGPIIALILAITLVIAAIFADQNNSEFLQFIAIIVPFIGFAIIPKSLKWSGDVVGAAGQIGKVTDKASGAAKAKAGKVTKDQYNKASGAAGENFGKGVSRLSGGRVGSKMEARGKAKREAPKEELKKAVASLDFDRQVDLAKSGKGKAGQAAKELVGAKQSELVNKRVLSGGDVQKLAKLKQAGMLRDPDGHLDEQFLGSMGYSKEGEELDLTPQQRQAIPNNVQNPFWHDTQNNPPNNPHNPPNNPPLPPPPPPNPHNPPPPPPNPHNPPPPPPNPHNPPPNPPNPHNPPPPPHP